MGQYYKELSWNEDLAWLRYNIRDIFKQVDANNVDFGSVFNRIFEKKDLMDDDYADKMLEIQEKYDLMDHCYLIRSHPSKLVHDPHNHKAEGDTKVTLLLPIEGCDNKTITSFVEPVSSNAGIARDERTSTVLHPDEEYTVIESFSVVDKPVAINNNQWHMMVSNSDVQERITFAWPFEGKWVPNLSQLPL